MQVEKAYRLIDGAVIPSLERLLCQACNEEILDYQAMEVIEKFRQRHPLKKAAIKRHKNVMVV